MIPCAFDYDLASGMVPCDGACVGEVGGKDRFNTEEQVLITGKSHVNCTGIPCDGWLMGWVFRFLQMRITLPLF